MQQTPTGNTTTITYCSIEGLDGGDHAVSFLSRLRFVAFDVASRVGAHVNVIHHPRERRVVTVAELPAEELAAMQQAHGWKTLPYGSHDIAR